MQARDKIDIVFSYQFNSKNDIFLRVTFDDFPVYFCFDHAGMEWVSCSSASLENDGAQYSTLKSAALSFSRLLLEFEEIELQFPDNNPLAGEIRFATAVSAFIVCLFVKLSFIEDVHDLEAVRHAVVSLLEKPPNEIVSWAKAVSLSIAAMECEH